MGRKLPDPLLRSHSGSAGSRSLSSRHLLRRLFPLFLLLTAVLLLAGCGKFVGLSDGSDDYDTGLSEVRLSLTEENLATLADSVTYDIYADCLYELEEGRGSGEIRVRGFTSRMHPKKSFTLKKNLDDPDHSKEALDAGGDPWISYSLAMYAYQLVGLPAPQLSPVSLYLNDEYLGYYNRLPLYTDDLDDSYGENGQLFKIKVFDMGEGNPRRIPVAKRSIPMTMTFRP